MTSRTDVLQQILNLMTVNNISLNEVKDAYKAEHEDARAGIIKKLFAFLGAIFIFSGIGVYIATFWDEMNSAARIIITLGAGVVLFILAFLANKDNRYQKTVTPLFLIAAFFQTGGLFVAIDELFHSDNDPRYAAITVFTVMLIQQVTTFWNNRRSSLLFTSIFFGMALFVTILDLMDIDGEYIALIIGISLTCISYHLSQTSYKDITPIWYLIGSLSFLGGAFDLLKHTSIELVFLGITCFVIFLSTIIKLAVSAGAVKIGRKIKN